MSENSRGGDALIGFLLGAAVGTVAALLLAPRTGKETRRRLQHWLEDLEGKGHDLLDEGRELLDEGKDVVKDLIHEKADHLKEAVHDKADRVKRVFDAGRKAWETPHRG